MAKSLGQIHTADFTWTETSPPGGGNAGASNLLLDNSGVLTTKLQRMVRCGGNVFKTVGIDMALELEDPTGTDACSVAVSGKLLYYAPTRGRVLAMREAYKAVRHAMDLQGIDHRANKNYDFRPLIASGLSNATTFKNQASIEILTGSAVPLYIKDQSTSTTGIFENWNNNVSNQQAGTPDFSKGWNIMQQTVPQDYVLNEGTYLQAGGRPFASEDYEEIPFQIALDNSDGHATATFQWRPDPALYLAVMTGQFILSVEDCVFTNVSAGNTPVTRLQISIFTSGWSSMMSDRKKRSSRRKKSGRKTKGKKK